MMLTQWLLYCMRFSDQSGEQRRPAGMPRQRAQRRRCPTVQGGQIRDEFTLEVGQVCRNVNLRVNKQITVLPRLAQARHSLTHDTKCFTRRRFPGQRESHFTCQSRHAHLAPQQRREQIH